MSYSKRLLIAAVGITAIILLALASSRSSAFDPAASGRIGVGEIVPGSPGPTDRAAANVRLAAAPAETWLLHSGLAGVEGEQALFDDLEVEEGEVIEGDVIVYDGNARVKSGGRIDGNLVVYSGRVNVDAGGSVDGSVSAFAGDVQVAGNIGGDLTVWSGDIELKSGAVVEGDISVLNGDVKRAPGATVGGNVVEGPSLDLLSVPPAPFKFGNSLAPARDRVVGARPGVLQSLATFILRLMGVALLSVLIGLVAWLIAQVRPSAIHATRATMLEQPALSFVVGILANVVLLLSGAFFIVTICLIPLSLVSFLLFIALNLVGWAVIASVVSRRITERFGRSVRWDYAVGITAAVMAGGLGLLWAMGGCFRFLGFTGMLIVSSIGAGAIVLPFIRKNMAASRPALPETGSPLGAAGSTEEAGEYDVEDAGEGQAQAVEPETGEAADDAGADQSETAARMDDFTRIRGLGPVAAGRLSSAGVTTYAELSQMTPQQIGEILRWSSDRVRQTDIIGQAARLADAEGQA